MVMDIAIYWLIFGAFCFALEAFGLTGFGLFFAGLGAISLAILMQLGTPTNTEFVAQFAWFFGFTAVWTAVLWQPIKMLRMRKRSSDYSNMVGDRCTVVEMPLIANKEGRVKWSGTMMIAELITGSQTVEVAIGDAVVIKEVKGNKLFVDKA